MGLFDRLSRKKEASTGPSRANHPSGPKLAHYLGMSDQRDIKFRCPYPDCPSRNDGFSNQASTSLAGKAIPCSECGRTIVIPLPPDMLPTPDEFSRMLGGN